MMDLSYCFDWETTMNPGWNILFPHTSLLTYQPLDAMWVFKTVMALPYTVYIRYLYIRDIWPYSGQRWFNSVTPRDDQHQS